MSKKPYWITTSLLAAGMVVAGIQELRHAPELLEATHRLGYPDYLLTMLGAAKLVGAPLLLVQRFPHLKEWDERDTPAPEYAEYVCRRARPAA